MAGNDTGFAIPTIQRIRQGMTNDMSDPDDVATLFYEEMAKTRQMKIEARILKKYGFTTESFIEKGKESLTEQAYYDLISRIDKEELSLSFLLVGFDEDKKGHLRVITADDLPQDYDTIGFAAIGSGASPALSSLAFAMDHSKFSRYCTEIDATHAVLAAKFMAESATDVGRSTFYVSIHADRISRFMGSFGAIDTIRSMWEKRGAPRLSREVEAIIADVLYEPEKEDGRPPAVVQRIRNHSSPERRKSIDAWLARRSASQTSEDQPSPCAAEYQETNPPDRGD